MAYPTAADLVAESNVDELTGLTLPEQEQLWRSSISAVEEFTGQAFLLESGETKYIDGPGGRTLFLPKRLDSLTDLSVTGSGLSLDDVYLSEKHDQLIVLPTAGIGNYYEQALRDLDGNLPLNFRFGVGTVQVTGDWGWSVVPETVRDAIRIDMEDQALADANALSDTVRSVRALGLRDISQGNLAAGIGLSSGISLRAQRLLAPYVWLGPIGVVV
jgi:hypothetical protein